MANNTQEKVETNSPKTCLDFLIQTNKDKHKYIPAPMLAENIYPNRTDNINFSSEYTGRSGRLKSSPEEYDYINNIADFYDIEKEASNTDFILSNVDGYAEKIKLSNPIGTNWCFVNVVIQILLHLEDLWFATLIKFGRDAIRTKIREEYSKFAGIDMEEQCDATLLLNWLLDKLSDFRDTWSIDWSYNYRCKSCGHKTNKKVSDNIWYIYPNRSGHYIDDDTGNVFRYDLGSCTQSQTKGTLTKQCEQCCGGTREHIYTNYIDKYPKNIFMNLQQFADQSIYIFDCIELKNGNSKKYIEYDLMGFVVHSGTNNFGHYKIYLQDNIGWRCYDDDNITYIDIDEVLNIQDKDSMDTIPLLWYQFSKDNNDVEKENIVSETVVNDASQYSFAFEYNSPDTDIEPEQSGYGYNSLDIS